MNEQEKKAIKVINKRTKRLLDELEIEKEDMVDEPRIVYLMQEIGANKTILNLIEKLQKELEELKDTNCLVKRYFKLKDTNTYLQKENEELKNAVNVVNKEKADWIRAYQEEKDKQFELLRSSIPIQEVKDKIEELKEQYNVRELDFIKTTQDIRKIIIQSLEELIEGKN